jgi:hypothetical protein
MRSMALPLSLCVALSVLAAAPAAAQSVYAVKPIAEMKLKQLPEGPLYWRVETFPTLADAQAAASRYRWNADTVRHEGSPALAAEVAGKAWLFTLGAKGGATPGGAKVAEIGPVPPVKAPEYLLRVNHGSGPTGSQTPVHTHPGSEAFYVVAGRQQRHERPDRADHVRGRCDAPVLVAGEVRVSEGSPEGADRAGADRFTKEQTQCTNILSR